MRAYGSTEGRKRHNEDDHKKAGSGKFRHRHTTHTSQQLATAKLWKKRARKAGKDASNEGD